jgi:hypothetical protein
MAQENRKGNRICKKRTKDRPGADVLGARARIWCTDPEKRTLASPRRTYEEKGEVHISAAAFTNASRQNL